MWPTEYRPADRPTKWPNKWSTHQLIHQLQTYQLTNQVVYLVMTNRVNSYVINRVTHQLNNQFTDPTSDQPIDNKRLQSIALLSNRTTELPSDKLDERPIKCVCDQTNNGSSALPRKLSEQTTNQFIYRVPNGSNDCNRVKGHVTN